MTLKAKVWPTTANRCGADPPISGPPADSRFESSCRIKDICCCCCFTSSAEAADIRMSTMDYIDIRQGQEDHRQQPVTEQPAAGDRAVSDGEQPDNLKSKLADYLAENVVGRDATFKGPFGRKPLVYGDLVSCGRSLRFIEAFILEEVLPTICSSNSATSMLTVTSVQTTLFMDEAR